jgi:hypothetical protein
MPQTPQDLFIEGFVVSNKQGQALFKIANTMSNSGCPSLFFRHGTVTRSLVVSETTISVRTVGTGHNTNRFTQGANYAASPYFKGLDTNIKATIGIQQIRNDVRSFFD